MSKAGLAIASKGFPKQLRLNQAGDFKTVFRVGKKQAGRYLAMLVHANSLSYPRLGLVVAKKAVRKAVMRNRIKRMIREGFRLQQHVLGGVDIVVIVYNGIAALNRVELRQQIDMQWVKLTSYKKV